MFSPNPAYEHCSAYELIFTLQEGNHNLSSSRDACQGFATLATLGAQGNEERYADFISAGAVEAIIGCLDSYGSDEVVALHSCIALYGLTRHSAELTSFVVECGGIESMLQCIPLHIGDSFVCFYATNALVGCLEQPGHASRMWMCPQIGSILDQLCYAGLNVRQKTSAAIAMNIALLLVRMLETAFCEKNHHDEYEDNDDDVNDSDAVTVNARLKQTIRDESIHYLLADTNFPSMMSEFVRIHYQDTSVVSRALQVLVTFGKLSYDNPIDDRDNDAENNQQNNNHSSLYMSTDVKQLRQSFVAAAESILKAIEIILSKTYSYTTRPSTWDTFCEDSTSSVIAASPSSSSSSSSTSLPPPPPSSSGSPIVEHHQIITHCCHIFYLLTQSLSCVSPSALRYPTNIRKDINYVEMKPPGTTGQGLGQTSTVTNTGHSAIPPSNNVLMTLTQPHMLSFFVIICTLLRLNVFKLEGQFPLQTNTSHPSQSNTTGMTDTTGGGACSGIDLACIYVIRGLKRILHSLDPETLSLRHIIRFKSMLVDQNLVAVLYTLIDRLSSTTAQRPGLAPGQGLGQGSGQGLGPDMHAAFLDNDTSSTTNVTTANDASTFSVSLSFSLLVEAKALLELLN